MPVTNKPKTISLYLLQGENFVFLSILSEIGCILDIEHNDNTFELVLIKLAYFFLN